MKRSKQWQDLGGRLSAYKTTHEENAKVRGTHQAFMAAATLTQARKALRGEK